MSVKTLSQDHSEFNVFFIPKEIEDLGLSVAEYRIYGYLARCAFTNDPEASVECIAKHCMINEDVIRASLERLGRQELVRIAVKDGVTLGGCL